MALWICTACDRHVQPETTRCPFCDTALGTTSALPHRVMMAAAVSLALAGCADRGGGENTTAAGTTSGSGTSASTTETAETTASTGQGSVTANTWDTDAGGEDYAGPETTDTWPNEESTGTTGESTDTGSTGTDTGSSSTDTGEDAGGQDYAGPETDI